VLHIACSGGSRSPAWERGAASGRPPGRSWAKARVGRSDGAEAQVAFLLRPGICVRTYTRIYACIHARTKHRLLASALGEGRMACFVLAGLRHEEGGRGLTWLLAVEHGKYAYTFDCLSTGACTRRFWRRAAACSCTCCTREAEIRGELLIVDWCWSWAE
jgi:hypothetical protein